MKEVRPKKNWKQPKTKWFTGHKMASPTKWTKCQYKFSCIYIDFYHSQTIHICFFKHIWLCKQGNLCWFDNYDFYHFDLHFSTQR